MNYQWKSCKLGDVIEFKRGYDLPKKQRVEGSYPIISSSGASGTHKDFKVSGPGVVTGRYGTLGEVFYIEEDFWPLNTALYVKDFKGNRPKFIGHFLETLDLASLNAAGAVPGLNRNHLHMMEVQFPFEEAIQKQIEEVLESYDNLIENNNSRIAILEEMAQSLYREWFVKFRFPGHDQCQMIESPIGLIPEGWAVGALKEVCHLTMGQSPKSEFYNQAGEGLPFYQGVKDYGKRFPSVSVWCSKPTRIAEINDILFSVRAPVGRLNIANSQMAIGRGLSAIRHKDGYQSFLFQQLKSIFSREDLIGNGAIFNAVTKKDMEQIQLISPPEVILKSFSEVLDPIFRQLEVLCIKNDNLKAQRDLLLPKLISGQIDLGQAEQASA